MGWDEDWHVFQNNWGGGGAQGIGESRLVMTGVLWKLHENCARLYLDRRENSRITTVMATLTRT